MRWRWLLCQHLQKTGVSAALAAPTAEKKSDSPSRPPVLSPPLFFFFFLITKSFSHILSQEVGTCLGREAFRGKEEPFKGLRTRPDIGPHSAPCHRALRHLLYWRRSGGGGRNQEIPWPLRPEPRQPVIPFHRRVKLGIWTRSQATAQPLSPPWIIP